MKFQFFAFIPLMNKMSSFNDDQNNMIPYNKYFFSF